MKRFNFNYAFLVMLISGVLAACSGLTSGSAKDISKQFVTAYYVQDDVETAVKVTTGSAKKRLDTELKMIEQLKSSESTSQKPSVNISLIDTNDGNKLNKSFIWKVDVASYRTIFVNIELIKIDGIWHVDNFKESSTPFN